MDDSKVTDLAAASPLTGSEVVYLVQGGLDVQSTAQAIADLGGGASWGGITGTLSSQTDLQDALDAKANLSGAAFTGDISITRTAVASVSVVSTTSNAQYIIDGAGGYKAIRFRDGGADRGFIGSGIYAADNNIYIGGTSTPVIGAVLSGNRVVINTTTDDGVNTLQVNGSIVGSNLSGTNTGDQRVANSELSSFTPLQGVGCKLWIDAADYRSITSLSGESLTTIKDKSGFANDASQIFGAKPSWSITKFNGKAPGIEPLRGVTTNNNLVIVDSASMTNIFAGGGTIAGTFILNGSGANQTLFHKSTNGAGVSTSGYLCLFYGSGSGVTMRFIASGASAAGTWDSATTIPLGVPQSFSIYYNTATPTVAPVVVLNGVVMTMNVAQAQSGAPGTDSGADFLLGNNQNGGFAPFLGTIGQFAMLNGTQTAAFMATLRSYLGALSGIKTANVYALCGQSNMVGNAIGVSTPTEADGASDAKPYIWDGQRWINLVVGSNNQGQDASMFGVEMSFGAQSVINQNSDSYLLKYAVGATSLAVNWNPSGGAQWTAMRAVIDAGMQNLAAQGIIPVVCGFLWTQGETDAQDLTNAGNYATNLSAFIAAVNGTALTNYTRSPGYKFLISGLPNQDIVAIPYQATVRAAQSSVGGANYIDTTALTLESDDIHFDAAGQIALGGLFAAKIDYDLQRVMVENLPPILTQELLVSGVNIKTVNGASLLGKGDIVIGGGITVATAVVDFGAFSYATKTSVAAPSVTGSSKVIASLAAPTSRDADELEFSPICIAAVINAGVGLDIYATAPIGADGQFNVNYTIT